MSSWLREVFVHAEIPVPLLAASSAFQFRALSPCWWLFQGCTGMEVQQAVPDRPRAALCWAEPALGSCSSVPVAHTVLLVPSVPSLTPSGGTVFRPFTRGAPSATRAGGSAGRLLGLSCFCLPVSHRHLHLHGHSQAWIPLSLQQGALKYQSPIRTVTSLDSVVSEPLPAWAVL